MLKRYFNHFLFRILCVMIFFLFAGNAYSEEGGVDSAFVEGATDNSRLAEEAELYKKFFGEGADLTYRTEVKLYSRKKLYGKTELMLQFGSPVSIKAELLTTVFEDVVRPEYLQEFSDLLEHEEVSIALLRKKDIGIEYDEFREKIVLVFDNRYSKPIPIDLNAPFGANDVGELIYPNAFSFYSNFRSSLEYKKDIGSFERLPIIVSQDGAVSVKGFVFEGGSTYSKDHDTPLRREYSKMVKDFPSRLLRLEAGDLRNAVTHSILGSSGNVAGVSLSRNFSLDPDTIIHPQGEFELILDRSAEVSIYVDGEYRNLLQLEAGSYDISKFPVAQGFNDIKIIVKYIDGEEKIHEFSLFNEGRLLAKDIHEFSYGIGFERGSDEKGPTYDDDKLISSFFHNYGVTDQLTIGGSGRFEPNLYLFGGLMTYGAPFWQGFANLGVSASEALGNAFSVDTGLEFGSREWRKRHDLDVNFSFSQRDYITQVNASSANEKSNFRLGYRLLDDRYFRPSFQFNYQDFYNSEEAWSARLGSSLFSWKGFSSRVSLEYDNSNQWGAFISLFWRKALTDRQDIETRYNTRDNIRSAEWKLRPVSGVNSFSSALRAVREPGKNRFSGRTQYNTYFADLFFNASHEDPDGGNPSYNASIGGGTALAYAGGKFALTRPIVSNFILVAPNEGYEEEFGVNKQKLIHQKGGFQGKKGLWGAASVVNGSPYFARRVKVEPTKFTLGADIGQSIFYALPTYKSGTLIRVGSNANVVLEGRLVDASGNPISGGYGQLTVSGEVDMEIGPLDFFTGSDGSFQILGLRSGEYRLKLHNPVVYETLIKVPENIKGVYEVGEMRVVKRKKTSQAHSNVSINEVAVDAALDKVMDGTLKNAMTGLHAPKPDYEGAYKGIGNTRSFKGEEEFSFPKAAGVERIFGIGFN